jgi:O-antigen/teichoic acid export membrane protein
MSKLKILAGETLLYGLGSILPKVLNFFLIVLHTRIFAPAQYGVITYLYAWVSFLNIIFTFGMETAFFRFSTKPGADPSRVFNLVQSVVLSISIPLSLFFITMSAPIAADLKIGEHPEFITWLSIMMLLDATVAIPFAQLRLEKRPLKFALARILNIVLVIGLNFYFLTVIYNPFVGVGYVLLANLIGNGFYLFFFARDLMSWRPAFDKDASVAMLTYAYPVMLTGLAGMTNEMFSRLTLEWWLPQNFYGEKSRAYALGVFAAAYRYSVLMNLAVQAFRFAAEPFFFSNAADKNSPALFARVNHYFVITCCLLLLGVSINMDLLKYFVGKEYWSGLNIVPILLMAYLFLGVYYNFSVWFKITDKTYFGTIITVGGAVLTIVLNYLLIPLAGYTGSSWAALLVYLSMAIVCYLLGQHHYPIPYRVVADAGYLAGSVLLIFMVYKIEIANPWLSTGFHACIILIFVYIVYLIEGKPAKFSNSSKLHE